MLFVDGENFTIRGQEFAASQGKGFDRGTHYEPHVFLWIPNIAAQQLIYFGGHIPMEGSALRAHYYTSTTGNDEKRRKVHRALWNLGFTPNVFTKPSGTQSKGVDIKLTTDMLAHAFRGNYDVAVLITGDGDFVPVVEEVKRLGKNVIVASFNNGLNPGLQLAADAFVSLDQAVAYNWRDGWQDALVPATLDTPEGA